MAAAKPFPELSIPLDYRTWLHDVRSILESMHMQMDVWRENWDYDFRREYDAGVTPRNAAIHAHDYWWQHLLAESWT